MTPIPLTPILVLAYNRPNTLKTQLDRIDELTIREIYLSIDGPHERQSESQLEAWQSCVTVAKDWTVSTRHKAFLRIHPANLGLYDHFRHAFADFFNKFPVGIVLEDDVVFTNEFINFVDRHQSLLTDGGCWSIEGNNPLARHDLVYAPKDVVVAFQETYIHTISGWASSAKNVQIFLEFCNPNIPWAEVVRAISVFSHRITRDPALRLGIEATWLRKMKRARARELAGSWDNTWELAGWSSALPSLIPNFSLSRESSDQFEGQSHPHGILGDPWNSTTLPTRISIARDIETYSRKNDLAFLGIWGIRRPYCWIYLVRLLNQRRILVNSNG